MPPIKSIFHDELIATAAAMSVPGKGLLAADESTGTIGKRLAGIGVENSESSRQALRELLFTTPGFEKRCAGVILYEETLFQTCVDGTPFVELLVSKNILPGIKVDKGVVAIPGCEDRGETTTAGLDGLEERCATYYQKGARFAKWRGVLTVGKNGKGPSERCLALNCDALANYAAICQKNGLVPIVEPEILTDGDHDIAVSQAVTTVVLQRVFESLNKAGVLLEGMVLKPNMVTSGVDCLKKADAATVAKLTGSYFTSALTVCPYIAIYSSCEGTSYLCPDCLSIHRDILVPEGTSYLCPDCLSIHRDTQD